MSKFLPKLLFTFLPKAIPASLANFVVIEIPLKGTLKIPPNTGSINAPI